MLGAVTVGAGRWSSDTTTPLPAPVQAHPGVPSVKSPSGGQPTDVIRVIDGDTFEARVHVWPGLDITTKVRLRAIDAPELKARCAEESDKARAARDALAGILAEGEVRIAQVSLDKYGGRVLAEASTRATPDVSQRLLTGGFARRYGGGHRDGWCG